MFFSSLFFLSVFVVSPSGVVLSPFVGFICSLFRNFSLVFPRFWGYCRSEKVMVFYFLFQSHMMLSTSSSPPLHKGDLLVLSVFFQIKAHLAASGGKTGRNARSPPYARCFREVLVLCFCRSVSCKRKHTLHIVIFIISSISIISIILMSGIWIFKGKKKALETSKAEIKEFKTMEALEFDLNTIKAATRNFAIDNKLGEGGFGEVYKGKLKDGQEVAIKRLSKNSRQGIEEFKNEVVLVARLQHKNLIKLLGFCLASKEKLLIYEFLRNLSLDHFLFDFTKKLSLVWEVRFKLIVGIARGLLYLHEDSRLKIIHRDLKPSNILLDEHMNPKISDFGLAKLFRADQTQDDTKRIVGTYGYMAPEYAMTGHFSVKSDVYSFGIIVLEIISGQKNRFFGRPQREEALLHRAWRLWNEEKCFDLVDTTLENNYPREEVTKCIHIGLLCIQENAIERPRMATIVAALNGQSISLPLPKAPRFFGNIATITNRHSDRYNSFRGRNEMDHYLKFDQQDCTDIYTGSEKITTLYPR